MRQISPELTGWFLSFDLKKADFNIPLAWEFRRFFAAECVDSEDAFVYNSWPFGVSSAPELCQFLVKFVIRFLAKLTGWLI